MKNKFKDNTGFWNSAQLKVYGTEKPDNQTLEVSEKLAQKLNAAIEQAAQDLNTPDKGMDLY